MVYTLITVKERNEVMLEKVKEFYEREYISTERYLKGKYCGDKRMVVEKTISYFLGIAQFVQTIGVKFEDIDVLYNIYKKKLEKLLDN